MNDFSCQEGQENHTHSVCSPLPEGEGARPRVGVRTRVERLGMLAHIFDLRRSPEMIDWIMAKVDRA